MAFVSVKECDEALREAFSLIDKKLAANDNVAAGKATAKLPFKLELYADIDLNIRKDWLVRDFLGRGEFSVWYGRPGAGKSAIVTDLCCHVALGREWFGHKVEPGPVLYVAAERVDVVKRRFAAFRKVNDGQADALPIGIVSGFIDLCSNDTHTIALLKMIEEFEQAIGGVKTGLVVIDTVNRTLAGGDENGSKEMGAFVARIGKIQALTNAHVLAIHHPPVEGPQRLRGHGALLGALDTTVLVKKNANDRTATVEKQNDGEEGVSINFKFDSVTLFVDEHGPTTAPVVVPVYGNLAGLVQDVKPKAVPRGKAGQVLRSLRTEVEVSGEVPDGALGCPDGTLVVSRDGWRNRFYQDSGPSDPSERDAARKAFDRSVTSLIAGEYVLQIGEWFWPVKEHRT